MPKPNTQQLAMQLAQQSPVIINECATRIMKNYVVNSAELSTISMLNTASTLFFSGASFFASAAIGVWSNIFVSDSPSDAAKKFGPTMQGTAWFVAAFLLVLALWAVLGRRSMLRKIKSESGEDVRPWWKRAWAAYKAWKAGARPGSTTSTSSAA